MIQIEKHNGINGMRLYKNPGDRRRGVTLLKQGGFNFFIGFDGPKKGPAGLFFGRAGCLGLFPLEKDIHQK